MSEVVIQAAGISFLDKREKEIVNYFLYKYSDQFRRTFNRPIAIDFHIKTYHRRGKAIKFSARMKINGGVGFFEANHHGWDLAVTMHKLMEKLSNELEHKFHLSERMHYKY